MIFLLELRRVSKYYGKHLGVKNINLKLEAGESIAFLGVNGSGKTTTFRMILGLLKPTTGEIRYNYVNIEDLDKNICGYLPEERSLYKDLTVNQQLMFLGSLHKMSKTEIMWRIEECLEELGIIKYRHRKIQELSKGNQQKIQLIAAILHQPKVLILDEPFTGLDVENVALFLNVIKRLKKEGVIILFSSHQLTHCEDICDHLLFLNQGIIKVQGRINELRENYPGMYLSYSNKEYKRLKESECIKLIKKENDRFTYFIKDKTKINEISKILLSFGSTYELKMEQVHISDLIGL